MSFSLYEFPMNERIRTFMRLESCFGQINHFVNRACAWDLQASLLVLVEIFNILEKFDVKNEISKELDRNINSLSNLLDVPDINKTRLQHTLDDLQTQLHALQHVEHKVTRNLRNDDLLNTVRQRLAVSYSINVFEVPSLYYWANQPVSSRQEQITTWLRETSTIEDSINLLLSLLRNSANFTMYNASNGFFQKTLSSSQTCQLVRIEVPNEVTYFPEASGSKHRVSVRFLTHIERLAKQQKLILVR